MNVSRQGGFSLVEIMVALAIVGILASVVYPAYANYIVRSRRIEGQLALLDALQRQERYYSAHNTYIAFSADAIDPDASRFKWWSGAVAGGSAYELSGAACPGSDISECVEVKAVPGTARVDARFVDADCGTLGADSIGRRSASGAAPRCWP